MKVFIGLIVIAFGMIAGWYTFGGGSSGNVRLPNIFAVPSPTTQATGTNIGGKLPTPTKQVGVFEYSEQPGSSQNVPGAGQTKGGQEVGEGSTATVGTNTVLYTETGFSPATLVVVKGTTVTFTNTSGSQMWVVSSYNLLPKFDQGKNGASYAFVFDQVGTWKYHNNAKPEAKGTIVVKE